MKTLILPVAGRSSRFKGMRPKWLLTMPDGKLMIEKAIEEIDLADFDRVIVVCLREHVEQYLGPNPVVSIFGDGMVETRGKIDILLLDAPTNSQSETVATALVQKKVVGAFLVKDCDNMFSVKWSGGNEIAVVDLNTVGLIDAKNKSYVSIDGLGNVSNIVEKEVISKLFCCGGYGFADTSAFLRHYQAIRQEGEVYLSHVIYSMLLDGVQFRVNLAKNYTDWGTLSEYQCYQRSFVTLFCDVDGVLLYNGSKFGRGGWATDPIKVNLDYIAQLKKEGRLYLIVTSCRPESEVGYIAARLAECQVTADRYIMGLPHTQRLIVNDFSSTNPYPSAVAINIERDSLVLSSILRSMLK